MCVYMMALMAIDKSNVYLLSVLFMLNSSGQKKDRKIWSNIAVKDGIIAVGLDCIKTFMIFFLVIFLMISPILCGIYVSSKAKVRNKYFSVPLSCLILSIHLSHLLISATKTVTFLNPHLGKQENRVSF